MQLQWRNIRDVIRQGYFVLYRSYWYIRIFGLKERKMRKISVNFTLALGILLLQTFKNY